MRFSKTSTVGWRGESVLAEILRRVAVLGVTHVHDPAVDVAEFLEAE